MMTAPDGPGNVAMRNIAGRPAAIGRATLFAKLRETCRRSEAFLAAEAHEFHKSLACIQLAASRRCQVAVNVRHKKKLSRIVQRAICRIARSTKDLFDICRLSGGKLELHKRPVDLNSLVAHVLETVHPLLEGCRRLTIVLPAEPIWLKADPVRLEQILVNVLDNAVRAASAGNHIWLRVSRHRYEIVVHVQDNGSRITPGRLPRIADLFDPGEPSTEQSRDSLGISLTLALGLTELHGGTLQVFNERFKKRRELFVRLPCPPLAFELDTMQPN